MVLYDVKEIQELRDTNAKQEKRIEVLESLHNLGENDCLPIVILNCSYHNKEGVINEEFLKKIVQKIFIS